MPQTPPESGSRRFLARTVLPTMLGAVSAVGLVTAVLVWSAGQADGVAVERQKSLASQIVAHLEYSVAHDQESVTVWDDAVEAVRRGDREGAEWIDFNVGAWMYTYVGHEGAYVLDPQERPIYASRNGVKAATGSYDGVAAAAAPLVAKLRADLKAGVTAAEGSGFLTPGAADIGVVDGHPAVISVKPIVTDTGNIAQAPGSEYLHIALRYLDGGFLGDMQRDYLFQGLRFSADGRAGSGEASLALHSSSGAPVGFFVWKPYKPGETVLAYMAPALGALFLLVAAALVFLLSHLRERSLKLHASEAEVHHLAMHDALTGLANRTKLNRHLDRALAAEPDGGVTALLCLDLDRFKQVNDTLGHPVGDELIRQFADRLQKLLRHGDMVARIGGDEFTVVAGGIRDVAFVETLSQRIVDSVAQPFDIDGNHINVGVSVGVALAPKDGTERTELARKADIALYHAKSAGRGRFAMFGKDMDAIVQARRGIEYDLRAALESEDQIEVVFQPLYAAGDGRISGVEALARWKHPQQGWISPGVFIPVAEESGVIEKLGELVLRRACGAAAAWPLDKVAVNVSAIELRNPGYAMRVADVLLSVGLTPNRLELEVTESALTDEQGACEQNIRALRELGVHIALDDFGTGFSSLSRLQRLAVDRIKIDRSFVQGFGQSGSDEAIVQAIVDLAKATGLKTTAEGVETTGQSEFLRQIGCDDVQGFLLSRPVSQAAMRELLGLERRSA